ncbi:hypothetical protein [Botryobacter ruber]|uniref:hypothetical protein n=1 Tax=Botryobacter ruber TaxID=2171629 RepID=UPI000FEC4C5B|nr:hypothetical protein [Botryobacter ruber]
MKHKLLLFFFFLITLGAQAQNKLSDSPADFIIDAKALVISGKGANAEKLAADLEMAWQSGKLASKQQQEIISISQQMLRKKLRSRPHFENFFSMLANGVNVQNLDARAIDNMLEVTAKAVKQDDAATLDRFMATSALFLASKELQQNKFIKLRVSGGQFSFAYEGGPAAKADAKAAENNGGEWDNFSWDDEVAGKESTDDGWGTVEVAPKAAKKKEKSVESVKKLFVPAQPAVNGPALKLENVVLTFVTPFDSVSIQQTSGQVALAHNLFVGEGGSYEWQVAGRPVSAVFKKYNFDITKAAFRVPDATLTYSEFLEKPIEGSFEFKSQKRGSNGGNGYPKFASFTNNALLNNLGDNIAYTGGFSLSGNTRGSNCLDGSLSQIMVSEAGVRKFRAKARNFAMNDSLITSSLAAVAIYQEKDSLSHAAIQFEYSKPARVITLTKKEGPYGKAPFFDTYHKFEIAAERVIWDLDSHLINFSTINTKTLIPVQFESVDYFSNSRFQQLVGISDFHPLRPLIAYAAKARKKEFFVSEVADYTKINEKALKGAVHDLSYQGFLDYDANSGYIILKEKAWHYVGAAQAKNDYDHLVIRSVAPSGRNAILDLESKIIEVHGVEKITFSSDATGVYLVPDNGIIQILANRDINFNGQIFANQLAFSGTDFKFNYEKYMIDLQQLKSMSVLSNNSKVNEKEGPNQMVSKSAGKLSGQLYLNKPDNKSGKEKLYEYPKFEALSGGQLGFSSKQVLGGAYDSTVYFEMYPFKVDSLSNVRQGSVGFKGKFYSGGIFPPFETDAVLMPDGSMGFVYDAPQAGLPAYGGKGMVYDTISLSSKGIESKGKLKYLTTTLEAPSFTFYPDSVVTKEGAVLTMAGQKLNDAGFPMASLAGYTMKWLPKADTMYVNTVSAPMTVFKENYTFNGLLKLSPGGMFGNGEVDHAVAKVTAPVLAFGEKSFSGKNGIFLVKSGDEERPALKVQDVSLEYDLAKGSVDFAIEKQGAASIEFPQAQYKASLKGGRWDMNKQKVSLKASSEDGTSYFYSLHPQQQGLRFLAASGEYDLKGNTLLAGGVPYIAVGDAHILPDSGKVAIAADATIKTLRNASIVADTLNQFHKLYAGNIDILSRKTFTGDALYDYKNSAGEIYKLHFTDFVYNASPGTKNPVTHSVARIDEAKPIFILPQILYHGDIKLHSSRKNLDFDGNLKLKIGEADTDWFPFKRDTLDPENMRIPILNPTASDGEPLRIGLHASATSAKLYNTFVSRKQDKEDLDMFLADGYLAYNKETNEFKIGKENRAFGNSFEGNVLTYNQATKILGLAGKINLLKPTDKFGVEAAGIGRANLDSALFALDVIMALDLNIPGQALDAMAQTIKENSVRWEVRYNGNDDLLYKLGGFMSNKDIEKYREKSTMQFVPFYDASSNLARSLLLSSVNLQWSDKHKAWYSVGKIGFASIEKEDISSELESYLEVRHDMNGEPVLSLYFQVNQYNWYYLNFEQNGLVLVSSDDKFNKIITSKARGRRGTSTKYGFYPAESIDKDEFIKHFRTSYLKGVEEVAKGRRN